MAETLKPRSMTGFELKNCFICGSSRHSVVEKKDRKNKPLQTVICEDCGFVFVNPAPSEKELERYYSLSYREEYKKASVPRAKHILRAGLRALRRIQFLKTLPLPENAPVLDIGAGMGVFIYLAERSGFRAEGLEPHRGYASYGQSAFGVKLHMQTLYEAAETSSIKGKFDVVTIHHVLEHLENPIEAMKKAKNFLREEGLLIVEVPNIMARFHSPRGQFHIAHLHYFSPWSLEAAAAKAGYSMESLILKPYTRHILAVFKPSSGDKSFSGAPENYRETLEKLKSHRTLNHYLTWYPYLRPLRNITQTLGESIRVWGCKDPRKILDNLNLDF